jgi:hypothetical protein
MRFLLLLPAAVLLLFRVPVLGRLLAQGVRILAEVIAHLLNLPDIALRLVGVRLRKKLRLHVVILRDAGQPVLAKDALVGQLDITRRVLDTAGIDLIVRGIHQDDRDAPPHVLEVHSNVRAYLEDLFTPGRWFEAAATRHAPAAAWLRVLGLGAPLFAVVVRSIKRGFIGCSLGIASDYVTASVAGTTIDPEVFVHEIGHALGLLHRRERDNLMWHFAGRGRALTAWQVTLMRGSRHVTFF